MSKVTLNDINVSYDGKTQILKGLNLEIGEGELVSLLGPSGCGKTTTLRVIAGFIIPSSGQLFVDTEEMTKVPVHKRNFGLVFQSYALFPHLSVYENVAFGLKLRKMEKAEMDRKIKEILEVCDLTEYAQRFPKQLSGGQRQRVALARALVIEPRLLLLDEPLSNLDAKLRLNMRVEIKRLQKKLGITFIYITHDQEEALNMSDRIAVMREGRFEQIGTPAQVYDSPKTAYVARFVGEANIVKGQAGALRGEQVEFAAPGGSAGFLRRGYSFAPGQEVTLAIRGEQAQAVKGAEGPGLAGVVKEKSFAGGMLRIAVELAGGGEFICSRHGIDSELAPGDAVRVLWEPDKACPVDVPAGKGE